MTRIQNNQEGIRLRRNDSQMFGMRKRKRSGSSSTSNGNQYPFFRNSKWMLVSGLVTVLLSKPVPAVAWLSNAPTTTSVGERNHRQSRQCRLDQLYSSPRPQPEKNESNKKAELQFEEKEGFDDLDSLRAHAAKLRREAESLETALEESKEAKLQKETAKVDAWIEDLLIEASLGDGTELLKTVDQVYETLAEKRYSARHVLKIFERLCYLREQESRSNCSPLMELLVDATGKLDCLEREDNPNKRWNHRVERVLRRKLFARDWNIDYVSEDEKHWY